MDNSIDLQSANKAFKRIRSYLAGRFVGSTRDEFFLNEVVKLLFCKYYSLWEDNTGSYSLGSAAQYRSTYRKVIKRFPDIFTSEYDMELELDGPSIEFIDSEISRLDLLNMQRDVMGDAYEFFMGSAIKGQSGQFFTPANATAALVEMIQPGPDDTVLDLACGGGGFLHAVAQYMLSANPGTDIEQYVGKQLYGIDKDAFLVRLSRIRLASIFKSTGNISCADSLLWDEETLGPEQERFDVILTNPPFGANITAGTAETLSKFELAQKYRSRGNIYKSTGAVNMSIPPQVVFLEQCVRLLRPGGRLGIVIPESMISSKKYGYVSHYILSRMTIDAVIGMPENLFKTSGKGGTHTKTCLMCLRKDPPTSPRQRFFAAEAQWCGHDSRGRLIPKDDIPTISDNYLRYCTKGELPNDTFGCIAMADARQTFILAPRSFTSALKAQINRDNERYDYPTLGELIDEGSVQVSTGDEVGKLEYGTGSIPFIRTSDIRNWEVSSASKQTISEEAYLRLREKQDVKPGDIFMVKDGGYLIGTCAFITELDTRIVYQSHILKFRVILSNKRRITSEFLLASLSSNYTKAQVEAKTTSLDIINSLGSRYRDIIIPVPKDYSAIAEVTLHVQNAIDAKIKARNEITTAMNAVETLKD